MNEEKKKRRTVKRVCDDLIVSCVIGYIIALIIIKALSAKEIIRYDDVQPVMLIAAGVVFAICVIRYVVEKAKESKQ